MVLRSSISAKGSQKTAKWSKIILKWCKIFPKSSKRTPKWPINFPKSLSNGLKWLPQIVPIDWLKLNCFNWLNFAYQNLKTETEKIKMTDWWSLAETNWLKLNNWYQVGAVDLWSCLNSDTSILFSSDSVSQRRSSRSGNLTNWLTDLLTDKKICSGYLNQIAWLPHDARCLPNGPKWFPDHSQTVPNDS